MNHNEEVPGFGGRLGDMLPIGTLNNTMAVAVIPSGTISLQQGILPKPYTCH